MDPEFNDPCGNRPRPLAPRYPCRCGRVTSKNHFGRNTYSGNRLTGAAPAAGIGHCGISSSIVGRTAA